MRSSTLLAGLFALLIVAGVSFGAGYYVAKGEREEAPRSNPVAALDTEAGSPDEGGDPLETPDPAEKTPEVKPELETKANAPRDIAPKPSGEAPLETEAIAPKNGDASTAKPGTTPAELKDALDDVKDLTDKLKEAGLAEPDEFDNFFNGPKVDFTATIGGQVTDALGVPVAGASVHANYSENYSADDGGRSVHLVLAIGEDKGSVIATTDGSGYWTATINRKISEKASLNVSLVAGAQGYADSKKETVTLKNEDRRDNIKLTLRGAGSVSGRVVNAHGLGVEGVTVSLRSGGNGLFDNDAMEFEIGGDSKHSAVTDGAGEFNIEGVPEGRHRFKLTGTGYRQISGPTEIDVKSGQAHRAAADFQVTITGSLVVKFVDVQGNPIQGWATLSVKDGSGKVIKRLSGSLKSDGVLEKNDPPVGSYDVEVRAWGYKPQTVQAAFLEGQRYDFGTLAFEKDESGSNNSGIWIPGEDE